VLPIGSTPTLDRIAIPFAGHTLPPQMSPTSPVAVIDVGSNSIKLLVAAQGAEGNLTPLFSRTLDVRISAGISQTEPQLSEEGMTRGLEAIQTLVGDAQSHGVTRLTVVATSAVRDAGNGAAFRDRVRQTTGHEIRILSGTEEANLIGRGLTCDPALRDLQDFYVFDLGGGSLECLCFAQRQLQQAASLQLGCVRLMEKFVADPAKALTRTPRYRVMQHVHDELVRSSFRFTLPPESAAVGTGGTIATVRAIFGARDGKAWEETDAFIPLTQLRLLLTRVSRMTLDERKQLPGLPPARADIFPTALATLIVLADVAAITGYRHSLYNLRYGLAAELLGLK
jgi:exopolyphosphatase/guanosine-5'-triphosphate,3'-diphosphate pyrophosphatase